MSMLSRKEEEKQILREKDKWKNKQESASISQVRKGLEVGRITPAVLEARNIFRAGVLRMGEGKPGAKESTQGMIEHAEIPGTDDTEMSEDRKKTKTTQDSKCAQELAEAGKRQEDGDEDIGDMEEEEEEGSEGEEYRKRLEDSSRLVSLVLEVGVMGDMMEELEKVPRKERNTK